MGMQLSSQRADRRLRAATSSVIETLEQRRMLTQLVSVEGAPVTREFEVAGGNVVRIVMVGNITADFIGLEINDGDDDAGIPVGQRTLVNLRDIDPPDPDVGADIYKIYISAADEDAYMAIAEVQPPSNSARPMQPFGGAPTLRIRNIDDEGDPFINPSFGNTGNLVIGALDIADGQSGPDAGTPIIETPALVGSVPGFPADAYDVDANGASILRPGIQTAPGVTIGKILIGGLVMGEVQLGGSIETFYAGAILTGDATGLARGANPNDPDGDPNTDDSLDDNFFVDGDIRNLITAGSIGTDSLEDDDPLDNRHYNTGVDIHVTGRLGKVLSLADFYGAARVEASRPANELSSFLQETEFRIAPIPQASQSTLFENFGEIGEKSLLGGLNNDTFDTPEYLHSFFSSDFNENDIIVVDGSLNGANNVNDVVDYYALPLLAGQTVSVDMSTGAALLGVFDPDGRLIATSYGTTNGNAIATNANQPFQFTADRPGAYRLAVGGPGDFEFDGGTTQRPGVGFSRLTGGYRIIVRGAADVNLGALEARGSIITDQVGNDSISVIDGDLGAIVAGESVAQEGLVDFDTRRFFVESGNLRAVTAESIGFQNSNGNSADIALHVRKGTVGLLRSTGTAADDILFLNSLDADPNTGTVARNTAVGVDYQVVDSATVMIGNLIAKRGIGVVRAARFDSRANGFIYDVPFFVADSDGRAADGYIGLIDTPGDFGSSQNGGPAIDTGPGGNVRYINVGGDAYKDRFFGATASPEGVTATANTAVTLTDDSGTDMVLTPLRFPTSRGFGQPVNVNGTTSGTISYVALPTRSNSGGRSGVVLVSVTSTEGIRVTSQPRSGQAVVDIASITVNGAGRTVNANGTQPVGANDLNVDLTGTAPVNVLQITGGAFTTLSNGTPGELVSIDAASVATLVGNNVGITPKINGVALLPVTDELTDLFPFVSQKTLIDITGNAINLRARQAIGNVRVGGNVTSITANSGDSGVSGVFEGFAEPIVVLGNLGTANIGEGILPSGSGSASRAGLYVGGTITKVQNSGLGSDIRGDIVSQTGITEVSLQDGAIIGADIAVMLDFEDSTDLPQTFSLPDIGTDSIDNPIFEIESVSLKGIGGIIGSFIRASDIGSITVNGGFGIITSSIQASNTSIINNISADGYGVRSTVIDAGSRLNSITANGLGKRLDTTSYTSSVRRSASESFDAFFGNAPSVFTDLHAFLGTTESAPKRKGVSNAGVIADCLIVASRNLNTMKAWQIQARDPFDALGAPIPFNSNQFPMRVSFGVGIGTITTVSDIVGASFQSGGLNLLSVGGAVERASFGISGRVNNFDVNGTFKGTSVLTVAGPEGALVRMRTGGSLFGQVNVSLGIGETTVGGDFGSPSFLAARNIDLLDITGNVLTGSRIRTKRTLVNLAIDGDVQAGATIQAKIISNQTIGGQVFGNIIVG